MYNTYGHVQKFENKEGETITNMYVEENKGILYIYVGNI